MHHLQAALAHAATALGNWAGHPLCFVAHLGLLAAWLASGPWFGWSDTWQIIAINVMTIETLLLALVIQNTANRGNQALHLKLDEVLRALPQARTAMVAERLEEAAEDVLEAERIRLEQLAQQEGADATGNRP